jgi:hypothetical protein
VTVYRREEDIHMPNEPALRPLTPRVECTLDGVYYTNLFEAAGRMTAAPEGDAIVVTTTGRLRAANGADSGIEFQLTHRFYADRVVKAWTFRSPRAQTLRIVEPFVRDRDLTVEPVAAQRVALRFGSRRAGEFSVERNAVPCVVTCGEDAEKYWNPFPAVNAFPVVITLAAPANAPTTVETVFVAQ